MSYCRVGRDSDVYVIATEDGHFSCVGCAKDPGPFKGHKEIYNHLIDHQFAKDKVPEEAMKRLIKEYRADVEARTPKWSPEEAEEMLDKLTLYFKEPVKPISQYCKAFRTWQGAVEDAAYKAKNDPEAKPYTVSSLQRMTEAIGEVSLMVSKSNLLARLLYEGEELRTEPCPIHKGHWSGCVWGDNRCPHCMSGDNVTGWVAPTSRRCNQEGGSPAT